MPYTVEFSPEAIDDLRRLDKAIAQRILRRLKWLSENFDSLTPEVLTAQWKGLFKLRVGSYRVVYTANREEDVITVHLIGHRRDIYKRK
jgi:mRNA interferase RelE/StbE